MNQKTLARWLIGVTGALLLALASAGLFAFAAHEEGTERPLRNASGVAVDPTGHIYCALVRDRIIQVYGRQGTFLYSFHVPGNRSWFEMRVNKLGQVEIADIGSRKLYVLSQSGDLLESIPASESGGRYDEFAFDVNKSAVDAEGATLRIHNGQLVRELSDGRIEVLVERSWPGRYLLGELAPALYPAGIALILIAAFGFQKTITALRRLASLRYPGVGPH